MAFDDDKRAKAVDMYLASNPTPENTMDIVAEIAEALGETVNGTRMTLSKAGVYIKKDAAETKSKTTKSTGTKVSKEGAQQALIDAIEARGKEVDSDIVSKLTGKAAVYFTGLLS